MRILRNPSLAEEATQEAFVAVWRERRAVRRAARQRARRGCCSRCAPGRSTACATRSAAAAPWSRRRRRDSGERGAAPADEAWARLERERLEAALATIPDRERELIELAYFEGYTQSELATRLGLPLGTVKRRTFDALARLRTQLEGER